MNAGRVESVSIQSDKLSLEGEVALPEQGAVPGVVLCHPHPLYGGDMDSAVIVSIYRSLVRVGIAALRFNFRGTGKSEGSYEGGVGELEDARAALSFLESVPAIDPGRIGMCGYSFGSTIAFGVAAVDGRVKAVAGVSPLLRPPHILNGYKRPKLFVTGTADHLVDYRELEHAVERMPEPCQLTIVEGADHFWWGCESKVGTAVAEFFAGIL